MTNLDHKISDTNDALKGLIEIAKELESENTLLRKLGDRAASVGEKLAVENARLREALLLCGARAGASDANHACRLVIETVRAALEGK